MRETPRQFLINSAAAMVRRDGCSADDAINIMAGECKHYERGTLGRAMHDYFMACSDTAHGRLIATVTRKAGK